MSYTTALTADLLVALSDAGVTGAVIGPMLSDAATVAVTPFPVSDDIVTGASVLGVQVRIRDRAAAGARPVLEQQDRVYEFLSRLHMLPLGEAVVSMAWRQRSLPLHLDEAGRYEVIDTYYLRTNR